MGRSRRVIAELTEQGTLDDARFARLFVQDKRDARAVGKRAHQARPGRARDRSRARGGGACRRAPSTTSASGALALLRQRFPAPPRDRRERDRALGVLIRKGYEYELALDALAEHCRVT